MAKIRDGKPHPRWGATKKQARTFQKRRDKKNAAFTKRMNACSHEKSYTAYRLVHDSTSDKSNAVQLTRCCMCFVALPMGPANDDEYAMDELAALRFAEGERLINLYGARKDVRALAYELRALWGQQ